VDVLPDIFMQICHDLWYIARQQYKTIFIFS